MNNLFAEYIISHAKKLFFVFSDLYMYNSAVQKMIILKYMD